MGSLSMANYQIGPKPGVISGFDSMPGCGSRHSFSFICIVTVVRLARPGGLRSVVANYASSTAAANVLQPGRHRAFHRRRVVEKKVEQKPVR